MSCICIVLSIQFNPYRLYTRLFTNLSKKFLKSKFILLCLWYCIRVYTFQYFGGGGWLANNGWLCPVNPVQRKLGFLFCFNYIFCRHRNTAIHWFLVFNLIEDRLQAAEGSNVTAQWWSIALGNWHTPALCEVKSLRYTLHKEIPYR